MDQKIKENRVRFLQALQSGEYLKGPIITDEMGVPLDKDGPDSYCAVGLAYTLFHDSNKEGSMVPVRAALGVSREKFTYLQREWNDSPLTFKEIAQRIKKEWGW